MPKSIRRSSLEVIDSLITRLKRLEKEKAALEKELLTQTNPLSLLTIIKIRLIADSIAAIIRSIRNRRAIRKARSKK